MLCAFTASPDPVQRAVPADNATTASVLPVVWSRKVTLPAGAADPAFESDWWGEDVSNTAYGLAALVAVRPDDRRAAEVVQWLMRHRTGPWWSSTRVSSPVAQALSEYCAAHAAELKARGRLRVDWNGGRVLDAEVGPAEMFGKFLRITLDGARLKYNGLGEITEREGEPSPSPS